MTAGIMNIIRRPLEGQSKNVLQAAINVMKERDIKGNITSSLGSLANPGDGMNVTTTINVDSLSSIEALHDSFFASEEWQDEWDQTASMCKSVVTAVLASAAPPEDVPENPKYMVRNIMIANRGKRQELIDFMLEVRKGMDGMKPSILIPLSDAQRVRATRIFGSLEDVSAALINGGSGPEARRNKLIELTDSYFRTISRIHYVNV